MSGLLEQCDHLLDELRMARALPLPEPALDALMLLRLHVAGLRGRVALEARDLPLASPMRSGGQQVLMVDFKMRQAGDHSLDAERQEVPA